MFGTPLSDLQPDELLQRAKKHQQRMQHHLSAMDMSAEGPLEISREANHLWFACPAAWRLIRVTREMRKRGVALTPETQDAERFAKGLPWHAVTMSFGCGPAIMLFLAAIIVLGVALWH